jgi:hypothetical protein
MTILTIRLPALSINAKADLDEEQPNQKTSDADRPGSLESKFVTEARSGSGDRLSATLGQG